MNKISKVLALGMRMCYNHLFGRAIKELWPTVLHCYMVLTLFFVFSNWFQSQVAICSYFLTVRSAGSCS